LNKQKKAAAQQKKHPLQSYTVGDARTLQLPDGMADVVLLLGPLYHLQEKKIGHKRFQKHYAS
jgi:ubiquinone/menaquinone biosynthesis C-methylase UbiE